MKEKVKKALRTLWYYLCYPYNKIRLEIRYRKKLKLLREQDPFIYD